MRHASLVSLSRDHHHGLALALRCRKQALGRIRPVGSQGLRERAREVEKFFAENLQLHFRAEEEALFPLMRSLVPESRPLIEELLREHALLRERCAELDRTEELGKLLFDLGDIIERHIRREERELFPLFENRVSGSEAEKVGEKIKEILSTAEPKSQI